MASPKVVIFPKRSTISSSRLKQLALMKRHAVDGWRALSESKKNLVKFQESLRNLESLIEKEEADIQAALAAGGEIET